MKKDLLNIIDIILLTILIICVLYATITGHYTDTKIIEVCNNKPLINYTLNNWTIP